MRGLTLALTIPLFFIAASRAPRQDEGPPRYLDARLVPAEGAAARDFVPRGWKLEGEGAELTGDLNKDGAPDKVLRLVEDIPVERPDGVFNTRYRALVVLLARPGGGFARAAVASKLLGCTLCAGALGDPAGGNISIQIKNGVLVVSQLSGSREATDLTQRFRHDAASGKFALIGQDVETYDRAAGGSKSVSTNYVTGVRVTKKAEVKRPGAEPVTVSTKTTRVRTPRRFIEDVDYDESFGEQ